MEEKSILRRQVRAHCAAASAAALAQASRHVMERLEALPAFAEAKAAALFWPMPHEIDTRPFIRKWAFRKRILLPVMQGRQLLLLPFPGEDNLVRHPHGVWEPPAGEPVPLTGIGLIVVPGTAFDPRGGRVGRGGGYYDRLLAAAPATLSKIGVCFDFQLFDRVPRESHDIVLDGVLAGSAERASVYMRIEG